MRQIATAAGVSVATVSMALRNSEKITAAVREKVRAVAAQLNYRPDPLIAALADRRREHKPASLDVIAYITAYPTREGWPTTASPPPPTRAPAPAPNNAATASNTSGCATPR